MRPADDVLSCGAPLEELARQVFEGVPPADPAHQVGCLHCGGALERIRVVHADVQRLAAEPLTVPASLLRSLMAGLRVGARTVSVEVAARGATAISEGVVSAIARRAALSVGPVSYASVAVIESNAPGCLVLRVRLVVAYGPPLRPVAQAVREQITRQVTALTGVRLTAVHVAVEDLA